ncbi:MAG: zf-HC2 domain-containing protein [Acidobacteria bacterium]|nr:zf-HC2 domain-containing protein [Acidobacteriota bacterium]
MDCRTASLLIEAYHDDELELVDAARLLAHFEACPECRSRCDEAALLRDAMRTGRPVDRCPEDLARRLAARCGALPPRPPRRSLRPVVVVLAGGCGLLIGWVAGRFVPAAARSPLAFAGASRTFDADVFCLRCALDAILPGAADSGAHRPLLRTADGRIWVVDPGSAARARFGKPGQGPRHVVVTAALDERTGVADVSDVTEAPPPAASPAAAR